MGFNSGFKALKRYGSDVYYPLQHYEPLNYDHTVYLRVLCFTLNKQSVHPEHCQPISPCTEDTV